MKTTFTPPPPHILTYSGLFANIGSMGALIRIGLLLLVFSVTATAQTSYSIDGDDIVCAGGLYTYQVDPIAPMGHTYSWAAVNGYVANDNGDNAGIIWANPPSGEVIVVIRDFTGATIAIETLQVDIKPMPNPVIKTDFSSDCSFVIEGEGDPLNELENNECFVVCEYSEVEYYTDLNTGSTYQWNVIGAQSFTPNGNTVTVQWGQVPASGMIGFVEVIETTVDGCIARDLRCVRLVSKPTAFFTAVPVIINGVISICLGQSIQFIDQSVGSTKSPIVNWFWDFSDGTTSTLQNPEHTYWAAGNYDVNLVVYNSCNCSDTFSIEVHVDDQPPVDIECVGTVCEGEVASYYTTAYCTSYDWQVTGGTILTPNYNSSSMITVQWGNGMNGPGIITLGGPGCPDNCQEPAVAIVPIVASTVTIHGPDPACRADQARYSIPTTPGILPHWTVTNGTIVKGQGTFTIVVDWAPSATTGTIEVEYYSRFLGCGGSGLLVVDIKDPFEVVAPIEICDHASIEFTATTSPNNNYQWIIEDNEGTVVSSVGGSSPYIIQSWPHGHGQFYIRVTNSSGAYCNTEERLPFYVKEAPPMPDPPFGPDEICPGRPYLYQGSATSPDYYLDWTVTDGTPTAGSGKDITVTWTPMGSPNYLIELVQVDKFPPGCRSAVRQFPVLVMPITNPVITGEDDVCTNTPEVYTTATVADNYDWRILPPEAGSIISGQNTNTVTVLWNNTAGQADVQLFATVCGQVLFGDLSVTINAPPQPVINAPTDACQNELINLSTTPQGTSYTWDFGNGFTQTTTAHTIQGVYLKEGNYTITVQVTSPGGCPGIRIATANINIDPAPVAHISLIQGKGIYCPGETVDAILEVVVQSPASGYSRQWYHNNNSISGATGQYYNATALGLYYAVITDANGCSSTTNHIILIEDDCDPDCEYDNNDRPWFTWQFASPNCTEVDFTSVIPDGVLHRWSFGDGWTNDQDLNPTHNFMTPGLYGVTLVTKVPSTNLPGDSCFADSTFFVSVDLMADFFMQYGCNSNPQGGPYTYTFINTSSFRPHINIHSVEWDFGDGSAPSTQATPSHNYAQPGMYNVTLTVLWDGGNKSCEITKAIHVKGPPVPDFTPPSPVCVGTPAPFIDASSTGANVAGIIGWLWDFGDGAASGLQNTMREYTSAIQNITVRLTITDEYGCTHYVEDQVDVNDNDITGDVLVNPASFCQGAQGQVEFDLTSSSTITSYLWSHGVTTNPATVTATGAYTVEVRDNKGCRFWPLPEFVTVTSMPEARIAGRTEYCEGETIWLSAEYGDDFLYEWEIYLPGQQNPVTPVPADKVVEFLNAQPGTWYFTVKISMTAAPNCEVESDVLEVTVHPLPAIPPISTNPGPPFCEGTLTTLSTTASGTLYWSTGQTGQQINVMHANKYGLTVTDANGCSNTNEDTVHPLPDFSTFLKGCYRRCDTAYVVLDSIVGEFFMYYEWRQDGNDVGSASGPIGIPSLVINDPAHSIHLGSGAYSLFATTLYGCSSESPFFNITLEDCECEIEPGDINVVCGPLDSSGNRQYFIDYTFYFSGQDNSSFVLSSPDGQVSNQTPYVIDQGGNQVFFTFTNTSTNASVQIVGFITMPDGTICTVEFWVDLPECPPVEPCEQPEISWTDNIICVGTDANGNKVYYFNFTVANNSGNNMEVVSIVSQHGPLSGLPSLPISVPSPTSQQVSGLFTNIPPTTGQLCLYIVVYDTDYEQYCYEWLCDSLPPCDSMPTDTCDIEIDSISIACNGYTANGPLYTLDVWLDNLGTALDVHLSSADGVLSNVSPTVLPATTTTQVSFDFSAFPPNMAGRTVCFRGLGYNHAAGLYCYFEFCIELPQCSSGKHEGAEEGSTWPKGQGQPAHLALYPNPATGTVTVEWATGADEAQYLQVYSMQGQDVAMFGPLPAKGTLRLDAAVLVPGLYLVALRGADGTITTRKLVRAGY